MKLASPEWKRTSVATMILSSGKEAPGRTPEPSLARRERLGVRDAALLAAEPGHDAHLLDDVDSVVGAKPAQLALVGLQHRDLRLDRVADVDELDGVEADAHHGVHVVDRCDDAVVRLAGVEERQRRMEARAEDELRDLVVI